MSIVSKLLIRDTGRREPVYLPINPMVDVTLDSGIIPDSASYSYSTTHELGLKLAVRYRVANNLPYEAGIAARKNAERALVKTVYGDVFDALRLIREAAYAGDTMAVSQLSSKLERSLYGEE